VSAVDKDTQTQSQSKFSTEDAATDLNKKEKMDTDYLQKNATDAISRAEDAKAQGQYQQAAAAYEEAVSQFEQAIAAADGETKEQLQAEIKETRALLEAATASLDQHNSVATTLQAAERSFKEGIARYVGGSQTVARIRFRQARDAFEEAEQAIDDSDAEIFAQPIEVSFEEEAMLPSMALKELDVLDESTVETLAAADIESITDLEAEQENEEITPAVVSDLKESDQISSDETALLTILSWWYEGASRQFTSETVISRRCELADHGFIKSA
jgi:tetratricopeptide (TPR) repeat protein